MGNLFKKLTSNYSRTYRVAILGAGPAGLFTAHAFREKGWVVDIFSKNRKSHLYGAQYLHRPIVGLDGYREPSKLEYKLTGDIEVYKSKVYGAAPVDFVSPQKLVGTHEVWDIRRAYDDAWERYHPFIEHIEVGADFVWNLFIGNIHDLIVNTVPLPALCDKGHQFRATKVWSMGDAPDRGQRTPFRLPEDMTVVCNGEEQAWYRASRIFDHMTIEWPIDRKPPIPGGAEVLKPTGHACDCWRTYPKLWQVGRYGAWDKAQLSHSGYQRVMEKIK